jgi:hypothetical protein
VGHHQTIHDTATAQPRAAALRKGRVDRATRGAFTTLMGALHAAPSAVSYALLEHHNGQGLLMHLHSDGQRRVWALDGVPHHDGAVAAWMGNVAHAWVGFWDRMAARNPGLVHHATTPARLSLLRDGERHDAWLDVFGGCRVDKARDLAPLLHLRTGRLRIVAPRSQHPYLMVPAQTHPEAVAMALSSVRWHIDPQVAVWDLC